jgi:hypothetical protein
MLDYLAILKRVPPGLREQRIRVTVTPACEQVLALDEPTFYPSRALVARTRRAVTYDLSVADAFYMLHDLTERSSTEGGFDQPFGWYGIAKVNATRLRAVLDAFLSAVAAHAAAV